MEIYEFRTHPDGSIEFITDSDEVCWAPRSVRVALTELLPRSFSFENDQAHFAVVVEEGWGGRTRLIERVDISIYPHITSCEELLTSILEELQ